METLKYLFEVPSSRTLLDDPVRADQSALLVLRCAHVTAQQPQAALPNHG